MLSPSEMLKELELLVWRYSHLGLSADLAGMTFCELAGLHTYLSRLANAGQ
jgi:hypothetical protein